MLPDRTWRPEAVLWLIMALACTMALTAAAATSFGVQTGDYFGRFVASTLGFHGALLLAMPFFLRFHHLSWNQAFGLRPNHPARVVGLALAVTALTLPVCWVLSWGSSLLLTRLNWNVEAQKAVTTLQSTPGLGRQIFMAAMAVGVVPMAEEVLFRGILYPMLKHALRRRTPSLEPGGAEEAPGLENASRWGWGSSAGPESCLESVKRLWPAMAVSGALFGAIHLHLPTFVPLAVFGFVLAALYEFTGSLFAPILSHSLFNLANLFFIMIAEQAT